MRTTRRSFLGFLGLAPAAATLAQAPVGLTIRIDDKNPRRSQPYVRVGQVVDYIGMNLYPDPTFIGSAMVKQVGEWDGNGYPVKLWDQTSGRHRLPMSGVFYDFELCTLRQDLLGYDKFWHDSKNERFHNMAEAMRFQRSSEVPVWKSFKMGAGEDLFPVSDSCIDSGYRTGTFSQVYGG